MCRDLGYSTSSTTGVLVSRTLRADPPAPGAEGRPRRVPEPNPAEANPSQPKTRQVLTTCFLAGCLLQQQLSRGQALKSAATAAAVRAAAAGGGGGLAAVAAAAALAPGGALSAEAEAELKASLRCAHV